ncbi:hypothetical protein B0183_07990 [Glaesserella parasuis]|uniref:hypothetical protein n=1 Tax=Glaesserella parasuis TaxID=738 RepID=UPI000993CCA8|nr:hypothetical protein [Glaesserella parasuis]OOR90644.1 hypothetical protein B0183_07990 [Glaesserella parasuis]STO81014.1 Uncharacterised protein [Glaesserella parasuis]
MEEVRSLSGKLLGYTLPPEFEKLNKLIKMQNLGGKTLGFLLPPEFKKIKGLVEIQNLSGITTGYLLPPEFENLKQVQSQIPLIFKSASDENLKETIAKIQSVVNLIQQENGIDTQGISQNLSELSDVLSEEKPISLEQIKKLITLLWVVLFGIISAYPAIKEIYKDVTDDPFSEICGALSQLEKEAAKFVEVNHRAGIPIYLYPKGNKSVDFVLNKTQLCMIVEPKGNQKRVKVIYKLENNKQITGYADRNKLIRLYKNE